MVKQNNANRAIPKTNLNNSIIPTDLISQLRENIMLLQTQSKPIKYIDDRLVRASDVYPFFADFPEIGNVTSTTLEVYRLVSELPSIGWPLNHTADGLELLLKKYRKVQT